MERSVYHRLDRLEGKHWWFCARRQILKSAIARFAPRKDPLRLLEAGCGTGGNLEMLSEFGSVEAFELDGEARELARRKVSIDVRSGMLPDGIPFAPGSFDIALSSTPIERTVASLAAAISAAASMKARYETHHPSRAFGSSKARSPRQVPSST